METVFIIAYFSPFYKCFYEIRRIEFQNCDSGIFEYHTKIVGIADVEPVSQNSPDSKEMIEKGDACDMHLL